MSVTHRRQWPQPHDRRRQQFILLYCPPHYYTIALRGHPKSSTATTIMPSRGRRLRCCACKHRIKHLASRHAAPFRTTPQMSATTTTTTHEMRKSSNTYFLHCSTPKPPPPPIIHLPNISQPKQTGSMLCYAMLMNVCV